MCRQAFVTPLQYVWILMMMDAPTITFKLLARIMQCLGIHQATTSLLNISHRSAQTSVPLPFSATSVEMLLHCLRLWCMPFANGPSVASRPQPSPNHESLSSHAPPSQEYPQAHEFPPTLVKVDFSLHKLPVELQGQVVDLLVLFYLEQPRKICRALPRILELRLMNRKMLLLCDLGI